MFGGTWIFGKDIYSLDITERWRIAGILRNRALQVDIHLLTYLLSMVDVRAFEWTKACTNGCIDIRQHSPLSRLVIDSSRTHCRRLHKQTGYQLFTLSWTE